MRTSCVWVLLMAILFFAQDSFSQDFRKGYVILNTGDTLYGELDYRSNTLNYKSCIFRSGGSTREYGPRDIQGYRFNDSKSFISTIVDTMFAESIVHGTISLYKLETIYLVEKNSETYVLESPEIEVIVDGRTYYRRNIRWKGILSSLISDCMSNSGNIMERADLNEQSLSRIVKQYNKCTGYDETLDFKEGKSWAEFEIGLRGGISHSTLYLKDMRQQPSLPETMTSFDPVVGVDVLFNFPRISERIGLISGLQYTGVRWSERREVSAVFRGNNYDTYISLNILSLPIGLHYQTIERKISWFAMGGVVVDFQVGSETRMETERFFNNAYYNEPDREAFTLKKNEPGFWLGTGVETAFKAFTTRLWVRMEKMGKLTNTAGVEGFLTRYSVGLMIAK